MKKTSFLAVLVPTLLLLSSNGTASDSVRCRDGIVSTGDSMGDVLDRCGEPDGCGGTVGGSGIRGGRLARKYRDHPDDKPMGVEWWNYNFGPGRFTVTIKFNRGFVSNVYQKRRGTGSYISDLSAGDEELKNSPEQNKSVRESLRNRPEYMSEEGQEEAYLQSPTKLWQEEIEREMGVSPQKPAHETQGKVCTCNGQILLTDGTCPCN